MRTYENKNTNIYSEGLTAIYTKICTFQNFPLYGICLRLCTLCRASNPVHHEDDLALGERVPIDVNNNYCAVIAIDNKNVVPGYFSAVYSQAALS